MAFLDNRNDDMHFGSDPLADLDRELAELRSTLDDMDADSVSPLPEADTDAVEPLEADTDGVPSTPDAAEDAPTPLPQPPEEDDTTNDEDDMKHSINHQSRKSSARPVRGGAPRAQKQRKKSRLPLIIVAILLAAALVIGVGIAVSKWVPFKNTDKKATTDEYVSDGRTIVVSHPDLGVVEVTPPKGTKMNTYSAENLVTDDNGIPAYYEDGVKISHLGADLSEFQSNVDFEAMKNAGVEFVMLRVGGRFYGEGALYTDSNFETFYAQAKEAGIKVGAYFLSQAINADEAREEANFALQKIGGKKLDYPVAFDWENIAEDDARTDHVTGDELTGIAEAFCDTIDNAGYRSIVYSNAAQMFIMYDFETMKDYNFWLADYQAFPVMPYKFDMWQYTKEGKIDGYDGTLDLDISFTDYSN